jgi:glycosyltransferase involved in cell wall biosynthesis
VVTSDDPALVEVGGEATRTAPVGSAPALARAVRDVVHDASLRESMIRTGHARAAATTWDTAAEQLVGLYETLL